MAPRLVPFIQSQNTSARVCQALEIACIPHGLALLHLMTFEQINPPFQPSTPITQITVLKYLVSEACWMALPISSEMKRQACSHLDLFVLLSLFLYVVQREKEKASRLVTVERNTACLWTGRFNKKQTE